MKILSINWSDMPLALEEIQPGAVAILDTTPLYRDENVSRAEDREQFRSGPFLCVAVNGENSVWIDLTSQRDQRGLRLEIKPEWRLDGSDVWRKGAQFVHDARKAFSGPNSAFVAAGAEELPHQPHKRPRVTAEGVAAVIAEMKKYKNKAII